MSRKKRPPIDRFDCWEWVSSLNNNGYGTKTNCPAGHPYTEDNTYYAPSRLNRMCRACRRHDGKLKTKEPA